MGTARRNTRLPSASALHFGYCFIPLFSAPDCARNAASLSTFRGARSMARLCDWTVVGCILDVRDFFFVGDEMK